MPPSTLNSENASSHSEAENLSPKVMRECLKASSSIWHSAQGGGLRLGSLVSDHLAVRLRLGTLLRLLHGGVHRVARLENGDPGVLLPSARFGVLLSWAQHGGQVLNINQVDAMRGPQVVAAVELEEDEEGEEEAGNPRYVCIHQEVSSGGRE